MANMEESVDNTATPASTHHLTGDGVLQALKFITDSLTQHTTKIDKLEHASGTGKT